MPIPTLVATLLLTAPVAKPEAPLFLSVGLPTIHKQRVLPFGGSFPVVVTNTSDRPVRVWRDWCSWGYFNLSLEFRDESNPAASREWVAVKAPRGWSKNYPDAAELAPGESIIFTVTLTGDVWKDLEPLKGFEGKKLKMRVSYEIPADDDTRAHSVWAGKLQTPWLEYTVGK